MPKFTFVIFYVDNPTARAKFYADLLARPPIEASPTFAMLPLTDGVMLGLWSKHTVAPAATPAGGGEVVFTVESPEAVQSTFDDWRQRGLAIAQAPQKTDFGHTFLALDPDGHRLRVLAPED